MLSAERIVHFCDMAASYDTFVVTIKPQPNLPAQFVGGGGLQDVAWGCLLLCHGPSDANGWQLLEHLQAAIGNDVQAAVATLQWCCLLKVY